MIPKIKGSKGFMQLCYMELLHKNRHAKLAWQSDFLCNKAMQPSNLPKKLHQKKALFIEP